MLDTTTKTDSTLDEQTAELMALALRSVRSTVVVTGAPYYADRDTYLVHTYNAFCATAIDDVNRGHKLQHGLSDLLAAYECFDHGFTPCTCVFAQFGDTRP